MSVTTVNLGYVPKNRGEYSSTASYYKDNIVQYNGSSYICNPPNYDPDTAPTASITGVAPYASDPATPNTGWAVFCNDSSGVGEGVYDVSVDHTTDNQPKKYADLSAALQDVPQAKHKGGMSIKFVQTSDNKYVQYMYMSTSTADADFANVANWEKMNLAEQVGEESYVIDSPAGFPYKRRHQVSNSAESATGTRYTIGIALKAGNTIKVKSTYSPGICVSGYDSFDACCVGMRGALQDYSSYTYTTNEVVGTVNVDQVFSIKWKNSDESAITDAQIEQMLASLTVEVNIPATGLIGDVEELQSQVDELGEKESSMNKQLLNSYFIGKDSVYSFTYINLIGDRKYKLVFNNPNWARDNVGTDTTRFFFSVECAVGGTRRVLTGAHIGETVNKTYYFTVPDGYDEGSLLVGGRANTGVKVLFNLYDVTDTVQNASDIDRLNAITSAFQIGYPDVSGVFNKLGNFGKHLVFPIKAGDVVRIEEGSHYTYICYLKTYDSPVARKTVDYSSVEGYTNRIPIEANEEYEGVVPADANFIAVAYGNDTFHDLDVQLVSIAGRVVYLRDSINAEIDSINAEIDSINAEIGTPTTPITDIADADYERRHQVSDSAESATGNRYTFGFDVKAGDTLEVQSSYSPGINVTIFDTFNNGCVGSSMPGMGLLQEITTGGYTTSKVTATCNYDGVLIIKFKKSDGSAITDAEMAEMKASITTLNLTKQGTGLCGDVEELQSQVEEIFNDTTSRTNLQQIENRKILYIGQLVQKSVNGNTFTDSTTIVTQKCAIAVPHYDVKVDIKLPAGYCVGFKTAYATTGWSLTWVRDSGWLTNGGSYTFDGHNGQIYRVYFGKNNGADTLDVATIQGLLNSGAIQLTYFSADGSVITRNSHTEYYVKGLMRKFTGTLANDDSLHKMPVFTHLSDIHGDAVRYENFVQYSDFLEADAALVSGDLVPMCGAQDYTDYIDDVADKYNVMVLPCMGNHDARSNTSKQSQNAVLSHSISKWSLQTLAGEDYPTFYYKDIPSQSIRIIALNLYCAGQKDTNDWRLTQEQITWFVDTLENTPTGYGVIIMMHSPETTTNKDSNYGKFYQTYENGTIYYNNAYLPIRKIVDAFISKTTFSGTFDEEITGSVTETITISADFTSVDPSTEFICYVTGHRHHDCIGYVAGATNTQLMCNIALGFSLYGDSNYNYYAEETDVPRGGKGFVQDLMNVYVVDRTTGNLRIARVGSNMNQDFEMRDYMTIPYKAS